VRRRSVPLRDGWRQRVDVFAYFNNDWEGYAVRDGLGLRSRLGVGMNPA